MIEYIVEQNTQEWLDLRRNGNNNCRVNGSDAAYILNLCVQYKSSLQLFHEIRTHHVWEGNEATENGHAREDDAAQLYMKVTGNKVRVCGYCVPDPAINPNFVKGDDFYFGASLDRIGEECDLEVKVPFHRLYKNNEVNPIHFAQLHVQMAIRNRKRIHYIAAHYNKENGELEGYFIREVYFNQNFWNIIYKSMKEFAIHLLHYDQLGEPPVDYSADIDLSTIQTQLIAFG